jgi:hypothetical protein
MNSKLMIKKLSVMKLKINWIWIMTVLAFNKYLYKKVGMPMENLIKLDKVEKIIIIKILKDHKMGKIPIKHL